MEKVPNLGGADSKPLTTFVYANTINFREVVQRLTGPSEAERTHEVMAQKGSIEVKKPAFKLHKRRQCRAKLQITKPIVCYKPGGSDSQQFQGEQQLPEQQIFSSTLNTPTKYFSNLSLGKPEIRAKPASAEFSTVEEEKAIKEKRFFLHPSPRSEPGFSDPELLNLFPVTSPKTSNET